MKSLLKIIICHFVLLFCAKLGIFYRIYLISCAT
nr:MAG TPA: hypothetical protein [Caudoviricetes sp.]